jgi:alpha-beta hydrolase superfamily lysophospholipase
VGTTALVRRILAAVLIAILLAWLMAPVARAFVLVAGHPSAVRPPADLTVEALTFGPADARLEGWLVRGTPGAPAVVLGHGFKSSREEMLPWARFLRDAGYNVLLFDTRACGQSGGATVGLGAIEAQNIELAVRSAKDAFATSRIGVLGISLGAGAAILAAADDREISAVVADSAWTDQELQLSRLSFLPVGTLRIPLPPLGIAAVNAMAGTDVTKARPIDAIARISPRPLFLIHSADDDNATTTVDGARRLFDAAGEPKQIWIAPRGGHVGAINAFPDEYRSRVLAFLAGALR